MATAQIGVKSSSQRKKSDPQPPKAKRDFVVAPTHPGKVLKSKFMDPLGLTVDELAARTSHPASYIEALIRKEERVSVDFAHALSHVFGTTHRLWLNLQQFTDDFVARRAGQH